jgi:hypothetical protein
MRDRSADRNPLTPVTMRFQDRISARVAERSEVGARDLPRARRDRLEGACVGDAQCQLRELRLLDRVTDAAHEQHLRLVGPLELVGERGGDA